MPWCNECNREIDDDELLAGHGSGTTGDAASVTGRPDRCPTCGSALSEPEVDEDMAHPRAPWHFKVLVVGTVVYLGYRLYQGVGWLIHHA